MHWPDWFGPVGVRKEDTDTHDVLHQPAECQGDKQGTIKLVHQEAFGRTLFVIIPSGVSWDVGITYESQIVEMILSRRVSSLLTGASFSATTAGGGGTSPMIAFDMLVIASDRREE